MVSKLGGERAHQPNTGSPLPRQLAPPQSKGSSSQLVPSVNSSSRMCHMVDLTDTDRTKIFCKDTTGLIHKEI